MDTAFYVMEKKRNTLRHELQTYSKTLNIKFQWAAMSCLFIFFAIANRRNTTLNEISNSSSLLVSKQSKDISM